MIHILDQATINKIAAGEVVERPASVVKELMENAIDAGSNAITVEIKDGGLSFIRITDNGQGIAKEEVPTAFIRHATSKILTADDLMGIRSLGFRGEALASIAAVAQVECITKPPQALTGIRYEIHGGKEIAKDEIGAPTGTTLIVRNLFFNVPARKKFLKTPTTEGSYITELVTRIALSHPEVSIKYIVNGTNKLATSGNGALLDVIYQIYGRDISKNLLPVKRDTGEIGVEGYIGKSFISKGNRSLEHYFINGRAIRSPIINKAIEEGCKSFIMVHKFPFTCLHFRLDGNLLDVNVHPAKTEFKYTNGEQLFEFVKDCARQALLQEEMIPDVTLRTAKEQRAITIEQQRRNTRHIPEPFEQNARADRFGQGHSIEQQQTPRFSDGRHVEKEDAYGQVITSEKESSFEKDSKFEKVHFSEEEDSFKKVNLAEKEDSRDLTEEQTPAAETANTNLTLSEAARKNEGALKHFSDQSDVSATEKQLSFTVKEFLSESARPEHRLIGQVFRTYWLIEYDNKLYIMDQHAAHEKVMFEHLMKQVKDRQVLSQQLLPPKVLHLEHTEHTLVFSNLELFCQTGFEIEDFGGDSIVIRSVPDDIMGIDPEYLFDSLLNALLEGTGSLSQDFFVEKLSGMACKAAIKGNWTISELEANALLDELLTLDNPYNCPHGRPTMIALSRSELERKFKRIQDGVSRNDVLQ